MQHAKIRHIPTGAIGDSQIDHALLFAPAAALPPPMRRAETPKHAAATAALP
eukprot:CAMPEP_0183412076 /NCGR_PEP_ID=MMETSP0370-20130417/20763_1 /TAXON_ID=268820 /ORGANISM="Peridinium aciculiferum, Strain PAER-2" /LENGTH=51 /DNA_ID=CAMNT_0025595135 /DNA_START=60 /DNA_END=211 /DNA_ORIENTATION=-